MKLPYKPLVASILATSSITANAATMYLNTGINIDGNIPLVAFQDADTTTTFHEFNNFNPRATSTYTERNDGVGVNAKDGILKNGEILNFKDANTGVQISSLEDENNNILYGATTSLEGFGQTWNLTMDYAITGHAVASIGADINMMTTALGTVFGAGQGLIPFFESGVIEFKYNTLVNGAEYNIPGLATGDKVLQLNLVNGKPDIANLVLDGIVDYSWFTDNNDDKSTSIKNLFNFVAPVFGFNSFYDIWQAGDQQTPKLATVFWDVSTNVDPNLVPLIGQANNSFRGNYQTGGTVPPTDICNQPDTFCRTTGLNLDVQFNPVPEPDSIFLIGIGLLGLGYSSRRASRAKQSNAG